MICLPFIYICYRNIYCRLPECNYLHPNQLQVTKHKSWFTMLLFAYIFLLFPASSLILASPLPTVVYRHFNFSSPATPMAGLNVSKLSVPTPVTHSGQYSLTTTTTSASSSILSASPLPVPFRVLPTATIPHNRCYVHVHQVQMWQGFRDDAPSGKITALVTENKHNQIGSVSSNYGWKRYGTGQHDVEVKTMLSDAMHIAPGEPVEFWIGEDRWKSTDERCSVGE